MCPYLRKFFGSHLPDCFSVFSVVGYVMNLAHSSPWPLFVLLSAVHCETVASLTGTLCDLLSIGKQKLANWNRRNRRWDFGCNFVSVIHFIWAHSIESSIGRWKKKDIWNYNGAHRFITVRIYITIHHDAMTTGNWQRDARVSLQLSWRGPIGETRILVTVWIITNFWLKLTDIWLKLNMEVGIDHSIIVIASPANPLPRRLHVFTPLHLHFIVKSLPALLAFFSIAKS